MTKEQMTHCDSLSSMISLQDCSKYCYWWINWQNWKHPSGFKDKTVQMGMLQLAWEHRKLSSWSMVQTISGWNGIPSQAKDMAQFLAVYKRKIIFLVIYIVLSLLCPITLSSHTILNWHTCQNWIKHHTFLSCIVPIKC